MVAKKDRVEGPLSMKEDEPPSGFPWAHIAYKRCLRLMMFVLPTAPRGMAVMGHCYQGKRIWAVTCTVNRDQRRSWHPGFLTSARALWPNGHLSPLGPRGSIQAMLKQSTGAEAMTWLLRASQHGSRAGHQGKGHTEAMAHPGFTKEALRAV